MLSYFAMDETHNKVASLEEDLDPYKAPPKDLKELFKRWKKFEVSSTSLQESE